MNAEQQNESGSIDNSTKRVHTFVHYRQAPFKHKQEGTEQRMRRSGIQRVANAEYAFPLSPQ
jgi:hypothetical protein